MFLLRCAFWLSLVYTCIYLRDGAGHGVASSVPQEAGRQLSRWCLERPASCAGAAERLTALVRSVAGGRGEANEEGAGAGQVLPSVARTQARALLLTGPR